MKVGKILLAASTVFGLALSAAPLASLAQQAPPPASRPMRHRAMRRHERHPMLRVAAGNLRHAKRALAHGAHDFGGHRVKAIRDIEAALREIRAAQRYDKH